jgi:hypothetical protein
MGRLIIWLSFYGYQAYFVFFRPLLSTTSSKAPSEGYEIVFTNSLQQNKK